MKLALLIGVSRYEFGLDSIFAAERDVKEIDRVLKHPEIGGFDSVESAINPSSQEMLERIEIFFSNCRSDDLILFYFSGHGIPDDRENILYLASRTTNKSLLASTGISSQLIHRLMSRSPSREQVVILDCCFSGIFGKDLAAKANAAVLASAGWAEYSRFEADGSPYTRFLVQGIETGEADLDYDGFISAAELHDYAKLKLSNSFAENRPEIYIRQAGYNIKISQSPRSALTPDKYRECSSMPNVSSLYNRSDELSVLSQWVVDDCCRLVSILGVGGIGKTALCSKLVMQVYDEFKYIIWFNLREKLPFENFVDELILFLSNQENVNQEKSFIRSTNIIVEYLENSRCLIILDNYESIFKSGTSSGKYLEGYELYGLFVKKVGESKHKSCLLITSREKPSEVSFLENSSLPVHSLVLTGLGLNGGRKIIEEYGCFSNLDEEWKATVENYSGNPLALKIAGAAIRESVGGSIGLYIEKYLSKGKVFFDDIRDILDRQFKRLSSLEKELMYWLAINFQPVSSVDLEEDLLLHESKDDLFQTILSLRRRAFVELVYGGNLALQSVILEYVIKHFIGKVIEEIQSGDFLFFNSHCLLKTTTQEHVRAAQIKLIITPILERLPEPDFLLSKALEKLRTEPFPPGYAAGNILNLVCYLNEGNVKNYNLSSLNISQAYLRGVTLHNVDFSYSHLSKVVFTQTIGATLSVVFSPDGRLLATTDNKDSLYVWDISSNQLILKPTGHQNWVSSVAFSPDGKYMVTACYDQNIRLWSVESGKCLKVFIGHTNWVWSAAFSPNGKYIISGCEDETAKLWSTKSGECLRTLLGHMHRVRTVAFSPDGKVVATGGGDNTVKLWSIESGDCIKSFQKHLHEVKSLDFSSDGATIATGSDQVVRIWSLKSGKCIKSFQGHDDWVWSVSFHPEGQILASGSGDSTVKLWSITSGECIRTFKEHTQRIWSVAFSPDGKTVASGDDDRTVKIWSIESGKCLSSFQGYTNWVWSVAFSPVRPILASGYDDSSIKLWLVDSGTCLINLKGHTRRIWSVDFSPNGNHLVSASDDDTIKIWSVETGDCLMTLADDNCRVWSVAFSPDGKSLISSYDDHTVRILDAQTGKKILIFRGHTNWVWSATFSPDGKTLASGSDDYTIRIWSVESGNCIRILEGHKHRIRSIAFSPDGKTIASGSQDETVKLWSVESGECIKTFRGHSSWARSIAFSPDGKTIASGSQDGTVKLWSVESGECVETFQGHSSWVKSIAFSPDGKTIASGSQDETVKLWSVESGECVSTLQAERPYEGMNIAGTTGLSGKQKESLKALGAIE